MVVPVKVPLLVKVVPLSVKTKPFAFKVVPVLIVTSPNAETAAKQVAVLLFVVLLMTIAGVAPEILKLKLVAVAAVPTFKVPPVIFTVDDANLKSKGVVAVLA